MKNKNILDYVSWFLENNLDNPRNTFKGNMKLQKLLFFAQLISLAKNNKLLFKDKFSAFENGMVIENVRLEYKNNLDGLLNYKRKKLSKEDLEILELTKNIYGFESAEELSNMSHQFEYWKKYFKLFNNEYDFKDKEKGVVPNEELTKELDNIKEVLYAYEITKKNNYEGEEDLDY